MKKKKLQVVFMLAFWISLWLAGCGSHKDAAEDAQENAAETAEASDESTAVQEEAKADPVVFQNPEAQLPQTEEGAQSPEEDMSGKREAAEHLLEVWSGVLQVYEQTNASALWALDYIDAYLNSNDWNDLVKARASCLTGTEAILQVPMPAEDLTEEEYFVLSGVGVDTSDLATELESASGYQAGIYDMLQNRLFLALVSDIYQQKNIEIIKRELAVDKEIVGYTSQYYCMKTNYLLLTLGEEELAAEYWKNMKSRYPTLSREYTEWIDDDEELLEKSQQVYESYQKLVAKFSDIETLHQKSAAANEDWEKLYAGAHAMANVPALLPIPSWMDVTSADMKSFLLETDAAGAVSISFPKAKEALPDGTYGMQIEVKERSADEINAYIGEAAKYAQSAWKDEAADSWYIVMPDYEVRIDLQNQTATILIMGRDMTFVPEWYIHYCIENS